MLKFMERLKLFKYIKKKTHISKFKKLYKMQPIYLENLFALYHTMIKLTNKEKLFNLLKLIKEQKDIKIFLLAPLNNLIQ